ncbi:MAG TPA: TatD family hydrolase [Candidatus Paceibacterota bacterium]|nr:TatD family hydrolase [Candidatus Paceibacterota bacterium]
MNFIDTHSHFNLSQFDADRDETIARMEAHDTATICVGIDAASSQFAVELAQKHQSIWAIVGQHPTEWCQEFDAEAFRQLAKQNRVVGVGECGLDYFRDRERAQKEIQVKNFRAHIELAIETGLPLMLHIRPEQKTMPARLTGGDAYDDALMILKEYKQRYPALTGTAHFFVGDTRVAQEFLDLGFYISFSGVITFAKEYESVVQIVSLDRILSETDAPFAAPVPYRGQRSEPWQVQEVVKKIAEIKQLPLKEVQEQLLKNAQELFKI